MDNRPLTSTSPYLQKNDVCVLRKTDFNVPKENNVLHRRTAQTRREALAGAPTVAPRGRVEHVADMPEASR